MKKEPFIFHSPHFDNYPRVTIVGQIEGDKLLVGASRCSSKDHFNKKIGVTIAKERIAKGELVTMLELQEQFTHRDFIEIADILSHTILTKGLKPLVLLPAFHWECMTKKEFDELELEYEFIQESNAGIIEMNEIPEVDEEGFKIYKK